MRILILHKWLVMGGIEKILINYLKLLSNEKEIKIDLILAYDHSDSPFKKEIPKNITTIFLFNNENTKRIVQLEVVFIIFQLYKLTCNTLFGGQLILFA